jgi:signal transduction histidine kinase
VQVTARFSRTLGVAAGAAVAVFSLVALLGFRGLLRLDGLVAGSDALSPTTAVALLSGGVALVLAAPGAAAPVRRRIGYGCAGIAAGLGGAGLLDALTELPITEAINVAVAGRQAGPVPPAAALAILLAGAGLAIVDVKRTPADSEPRLRPAGPLLVGATIIALVALVPRLVALGVPHVPGPGVVMSPYSAVALLVLALGTMFARPEHRPLATAVEAGPGVTLSRRIGPVLLAVPFVAALVSALAVRGGVSRPAAAISTGAIVAVLALTAVLARLVRSLELADRRQRELMTELRERHDFATTLLQSMNEAVMVLDADSRVVDVNRRWQELTGRGADGAVGALPPYPWEDGTDLLRPDGHTVPVIATRAPIAAPGGQARGYVATYVDISDRIRAERTLAAHAAELELSNDQLRDALAFKSDLTSMLTHDVAQPISSIASLAELLASAWDELPNDDRLELATKIDKNTRRLISMMSDLTLLFRLDTGSVTARRTPVPIREVVETAMSAVGPAGADIAVDVDPALSALADRGHVWHVVQHLLSNAVKYGQAPIVVRGRQEGDRIVVLVEDNGPGVPTELIPTLFDRFMRGTGMGLFIVRHLVEANGGAVRYEAAEPGARLVLTWETAKTTADSWRSASNDAASRT